MRKTLGIILVLLAAAGAPLAHILRVAEVAPPAAQSKAESREAPQYRLVFASDFDPLAKAAKPAESKKPASKSDDVRLLKVLDEQWETSARVQLDCAEVPELPSIPLPNQGRGVDAPNGSLTFVPFEFSPPNPPARGPPL